MRPGTWLSDRHYNCYSYYLETQEPIEDSHPCISATEQSGLYPVYCWDIPKRISFHWFSHVDSAPRGKWIGRELITSWLPQRSSFKRPRFSWSRQASGKARALPPACLCPAASHPRAHAGPRSSSSLLVAASWLPWRPGVGSEPGDK